MGMDYCGHPITRSNSLPSDGTFSPYRQDAASRTTDHSLREQPGRKERGNEPARRPRPGDDKDATPPSRNFEDSEETQLPSLKHFI